MVRRKTREVATGVPAWVLHFDPIKWASLGGVNGWREAIREWCKSEDLAKRDLDTWMLVVRNFVAERHRTASNFSYESEAH